MLTGVFVLQSVSEMDTVAAPLEAPLGPIYSFVPAGGVHHASDQRVSEMTRRLVESLHLYLEADGDGRSVLLADFQKDPGTAMQPKPFTILCADLSNANPGQARNAVWNSEVIFLVSATDPVSIDEARETAAWLRTLKSDDCLGLLLMPSPDGVTSREAEKITGIPVCAVIQSASDLAQLARWIALE